MRAYVLGTSGSGKTRFSLALASALQLTHLELDALRHQPNWTPLPEGEMRQRVADFCIKENWVVDGNYSFVRDLVIARATDLFLLDYPRYVIMRRVIFRSLSRVITRKQLWNGNRESWKFLFRFNRDENVVLWAWSTYSERRRSFDRLIEECPAEINVHRFRSTREARRWLNGYRLR